MSTASPVLAGQFQVGWRSCSKCQGIYFGGFPNNAGRCPAGGAHDPLNSFGYKMLYNAANNPHVQAGWASCSKCQGMHFGGIQGVCPAGGAHDAAGSFHYAMPHDVPAAHGLQDQFKSCTKCQQLFYGPFGGKCPATGGAHNPANSFNYSMPVDSYDLGTHTFTKPVTTSDGTPIGGYATLVVKKNGDGTITMHAHDSGADNIDYTMMTVMMSASGIAFTFAHSGHCEGTTGALLGNPKRDDDFVTSGNNASITNEWGGIIQGAGFDSKISGTDALTSGIENPIGGLVAGVAQELGKEGATAAIALLVA